MSSTTHNHLGLGDLAPDFVANTTEGKISFHKWIGSSWCILFSHPKDFTPVCTTELGYAAKIKKDFDSRNVKIITLSVGDVETHKRWIPDINETQHVIVNYPIIDDADRHISELYGMIHPQARETSTEATVRTVFIIDPSKKIRLTMAYPASTGRNFNEILRLVDALQLTDNYKVATPVNWKKGEECVILPSITDPKELKELFPNGYRELKPYLRIIPDPSSQE